MINLHVRRVAYALTVFVSVVMAGGTVLWWLGKGHYSLFETAYFSLIASAGVGFSELTGMENRTVMRLATSVLIISGLGVIAFFQSTLTALFVEGIIGESFRRRRMERKIASLEGHFVVAGCGRTGKYIVEELAAIKRNYVVIDSDEHLLRKMNDELGGNLLYVIGDATHDHTLLEAGVDRAQGFMAALSEDRDNLICVLSVRALNSKARIVSKVIELENESKMVRAGADQTVSPHRIGGLRMVSELVRPKVTGFLDRMLRVTKNLRFEEVELAQGSQYAGKALRDVPIREKTRLLVVAVHEPDDKYIYNPEPDHPLIPGSQLIVMGEPDGVEKLRQMLKA